MQQLHALLSIVVIGIVGIVIASIIFIMLYFILGIAYAFMSILV